MRTATRSATTISLLAVLALCTRSSNAQNALAHLKFPTRAFLVEGGSIALQAGVMQNPDVERLPFGKFRYPTRYFVTVMNETGGPVWAEIEWRFPGEKPKPYKGSRIDPGETSWFWWNTWGVSTEKPINIRISVYSDERLTSKIGSEETFMLFDAGKDKEEFLRSFSGDVWSALREPESRKRSPRRGVMWSGWPEMGHVAKNVQGTLADAELQGDIQLLLWKEESKQHRDCKHETVRAEPAPLESSAIITGMLAAGGTTATAAQNLLERARDPVQQGVVHLERWVMGSCGILTTYEVLLMPSPGAGTDIIIKKAAEETAAQKP